MADQENKNPLAVLRIGIEKMRPEWERALPKHISVEKFQRVVLTAIQQNPELLDCDKRSLWNAATRAAQDGLLPDGREGAMVVRYGKGGKSATWQPMIAGIRKKVRNSDEIATWDVHVVRQGDHFDFELGDTPYIKHKPNLTADPGPIIAVYSVATLKSGEKSRDVMSVAEVCAVRDRYSDAWKAFKAGKIKSTPWNDSFEEMAKKTVARRHSKVLPMSTDLDELLRADDEYERPAAPPLRLEKKNGSSPLDDFAETPLPPAEEEQPSEPQDPIENMIGASRKPDLIFTPDEPELPAALDRRAKAPQPSQGTQTERGFGGPVPTEPRNDTASSEDQEGVADAYERGKKDRKIGIPLKDYPSAWKTRGFQAWIEARAAGWQAQDEELK